ncbi:MAG: hypothetical protein ABIN89_17565 [Chitinophagaceae bacterium]
MQTFLIILGILVLYKFIVDFVIPIYKTSRRVQQQFRDMQQRAKQDTPGNQNTYNASSVNDPAYDKSKSTSKDYIDFEEIKD